MIMEVVSHHKNCSKKHSCCHTRLSVNLNHLRMQFIELTSSRDHVKERIVAAEAQQLSNTNEVDAWLKDVQDMQFKVDCFLFQGSAALVKRCLNNFLQDLYCYKFNKKVMKILTHLEDLKKRGEFRVVAEPRSPQLFQPKAYGSTAAMNSVRGEFEVVPKSWPSRLGLESYQSEYEKVPLMSMPENFSVGLESIFATTWNFLIKDTVGIMGVYGVRGVGKTTLLKKLEIRLFNTAGSFDCFLLFLLFEGESVENLQRRIGAKLNLSWPKSMDMNSRAVDISKIFRSNRFVILFDGVWEKLDLVSIGIPLPDSENKSKIIFTTRSEIMCGLMEADKVIKMECLSEHQAWKLFRKKVGDDTFYYSHPEIPVLAERVVEKCGGIPLVLNVIGGALTSKKSPQEWEHAITTLENQVLEHSGMGDTIFPLLKFSYDNLPNESVKLCFLFCSLYIMGEGFPVDSLITKWIGVGLIHGFDDMEGAFNTGYEIVDILKAACFLEYGVDAPTKYVTMHVTVREFAHWIARECGREMYRTLVIEGTTEEPNCEKWKGAQTTSIMGSVISQINGSPESPNLSTLLIRDNYRLLDVHDEFFLFMPALRILDLSGAWMKKFPRSIGGLLLLEYLDLSRNLFRRLPSEMKRLKNLKCLLLLSANRSRRVPAGVIKHLSNLRMVSLSDQAFGKREEDMLAGFQELECLGELKVLRVQISNVNVLGFLLSNPKLVLCVRTLIIYNIKLISVKMTMLGTSSSSSSSSGRLYAKRLHKLVICHCPEMEELAMDSFDHDMDTVFKKMKLVNLPKLVVSWDITNRSCPCFRNLHRIAITKCDSMLDISWLVLVPNVEYLHIESCRSIKMILSTSDDNTFSNLKSLRLDNLPNLSFICEEKAFNSLKWIAVRRCPKLRVLPLRSNKNRRGSNPKEAAMGRKDSHRLVSITGEAKWWNTLDFDFKCTFHSFFLRTQPLEFLDKASTSE